MPGLLDPTEDVISPEERRAIAQQNLFSTLLQGGMQLVAGGENLYPWQRAQMIGQAAQTFGGMPAQQQQMLANAAQMKLRGIQGAEAKRKLQDQREWDETLKDPQKIQAFIGSLPQQYQGMALAQLKAQGPAAVTQILQHANDTELKNLQIQEMKRNAARQDAWTQMLTGGAPAGGGTPAPTPIGPQAGGSAAQVPLQPAQQVLASPSAAPAQPWQPMTIPDLMSNLNPAQRVALAGMKPDVGVGKLFDLANQSDKVAAWDTATKQAVFVPKNLPPNNRFVPMDAEKMRVEADKFAQSQRQDMVNPDGTPNMARIEAERQAAMAKSGVEQGAHADRVLVDQAAKEHGELQTGAINAQRGLAQINRLGGLLNQMNTGRFASTTQDVLAMGKGLGIDLKSLGIDDKTGVAQAADALSKSFALQLRDPSQGAGMPGAMSDSDRKFLSQMVPTLETTPEGRQLMLGYAQKMYERQIELGKIANDYVRGGGLKKDPAGLYAKLQEYANANPMFAGPDATNGASQGGGIPTVNSPEEAMRLPKGTRFKDPQGNIRVVQ